jgi:hypothetical protein
MNLQELITQNKSYEELKGLALVFNSSLKNILEATQETFNNQHKASPVSLTDGRFMLCADLLTEIAPGGLYSQGFGLLDTDLFAQVEVISMEEVSALLPQSEEEPT